MGNTYYSLSVHCVFSTKNREPWIDDELQPRLWAYMGGTLRRNNMVPLTIGGTADHVHLLFSMRCTLSVSKAVQLVKSGSSKWIHDSFPGLKSFAWQIGYGAFSVSRSHIDRTIDYIRHQKAHHGVRSFKQEYVAILETHGVEYDERLLWG
jgi:putative transposase